MQTLYFTKIWEYTIYIILLTATQCHFTYNIPYPCTEDLKLVTDCPSQEIQQNISNLFYPVRGSVISKA